MLTFSENPLRQALAGALFWFRLDRLAFRVIGAKLNGIALWRSNEIVRVQVPDDPDGLYLAVRLLTLSGPDLTEQPDLSDPSIQ